MANHEIAKTVAEKARKWQQLSRLLTDPEIVAFLTREFSTAHASGTENREPFERDVEHFQQGAKPKRGDRLRMAAEACRSFLPLVPFTSSEVETKMEQNGFVFSARDKKISVNSALRKLVKRGVIRVHTPGVGRTPSKYEVPPKD